MLFNNSKFRASLVLLVGIILVSSIVPAVGSFEADDGRLREPTPFERYLSVQQARNEMKEHGQAGSLSVPDDNTFSYYSGPFPIANDDGSLPEVNSPSLEELMNEPPYFIGNGMEVTGAYEYYVVGYAHEMLFGDLNYDGLLTWVVFYFDMGMSVNGIDDDGDGCIDETSNMTSDGELCDNVPDAVVFFSNGGLPSISGDLIAFVDVYVDGMIKLFRIGASPRWVTQGVRGVLGDFYTQVVGEFVTYYGAEHSHGINVNKAIGDKDFSDKFIGIIDARKFPARPPKNHYCRTGIQVYYGYASLRQDGSALVAFELYEYYDEAPGYDNDYNDDGDTSDYVMAYFIVDSRTGRCREFVNTGVWGYRTRVAGNIITNSYTHESSDKRDWDNDGSISGYVSVWHDVTSTEDMAGNPYFGHTFSTPVPRGPSGDPNSYGFGFTGLSLDGLVESPYVFPMEFGGSYSLYVGGPVHVQTHYWHVLDEDWVQWTELPRHPVVNTQPGGTPGGTCILVRSWESVLDIDVNEDGDKLDGVFGVFCPDPNAPGTGKWETEPASKHPPWFIIEACCYFYFSYGGSNLITIPLYDYREWTPPTGEDTAYYNVAANWHFNKVDPNFEILDAGWDGDGRVQLGGNITGYIDVQNVWPINILCHARLDSDLGWEMRSNGCVENTERDGILHQGETARIHFTLYAPDKEKPGIFTLTVELTLQRITKSVQMVVELYR